MEKPQLSSSDHKDINDWFKSRMEAICSEFDNKYHKDEWPFYPLLAGIRLKVMNEFLEELKTKFSHCTRNWKIKYLYKDGKHGGVAFCNDYLKLPQMLKDIIEDGSHDIHIEGT